ncbi:GntR family transcriptional regulator [Microvirga sp. HBU67558]|uniref:GntR family transcriptional regulator n=1 Tax=Microvirga TaxID=186650 RepID=UPI001B35F10A|nr:MULTISPECIES: GntR family transcriptional regulator [unclassified Microvirga]MBQ0824370.1 GntR family transcriptional regulator [Microvirga sp. HBU67558]
MSTKSRVNKFGRSDKAAQHVRLYRWLRETAAWKSLEVVDRALYIELLGRYCGPSTNNGRIPYSVREAAEALHVGKSTAAEAFRRLQERGFIVSAQKGGFTCKIRHSTEWLLTEFNSDVEIPDLGIKAGDLARKDFTRWQPEKQKPVPLADRTISDGGQYDTSDRTELPREVAYGT